MRLVLGIENVLSLPVIRCEEDVFVLNRTHFTASSKAFGSQKRHCSKLKLMTGGFWKTKIQHVVSSLVLQNISKTTTAEGNTSSSLVVSSFKPIEPISSSNWIISPCIYST